MTAVYHPAATT